MRRGDPQLLSEFVATFGLVTVIGGCARHRASAVPFAVGAYIAAAYWFTASTSLANPAVTLARALSDTFVGSPDAQLRFFTRIYFELETRIKIFASLRLDDLDSLALRRRLDAIGRDPTGEGPPGSMA